MTDSIEQFRERLKRLSLIELAGIAATDGARVEHGNLSDAELAEMQALHEELIERQKVADDSATRIELAGGYHQRTPREVEIEELVNSLSGIPATSASINKVEMAIRDLLALVDAGRNRLHEAEEKLKSSER